jgi:beta-aspartyl-peptidase (threonine type)
MMIAGPDCAAVLGLLVLVAGCASGPRGDTSDTVSRIEWGLVLHGGAGTISPDDLSPDLERQYREAMEQALRAGHAILRDGGSGLDAVVAAIVVLEDSPHFNAGRGAVFTADGTVSHDASIMDGATGRAGAVAGVGTVKNPIRLARAVMDASPHVMLSGPGAEQFAAEQGLEVVDPKYFFTERRWQQLERARALDAGQESADPGAARSIHGKFGTVGVIALDRQGRIAAGTSTGGMTNKKWGRIGDSPIIGAGTFASERCGVSATGWGEYFIRNVVAYDICARSAYLGIPVAEAARRVILDHLEAQEPETGGVVALDRDGHVIMVFNTTGMYRGYIGADGRIETAIYR